MLLRFEKVSKKYLGEFVLSEVDWVIQPGTRCGLIGANGSGKTTLFRLIIGDEDPDDGKIERSPSLNLGYVAQHAEFSEEETVRSYLRTAFTKLIQKGKELEAAQAELAESPSNSNLLERVGRLQNEFEHLGGYRIDVELERVGSGLGFQEADFDRPVAVMSGGEQSRVLLARELLCQPELLLLDEPTNHLDIQAVEWLEQYLSDYPGAFIVISHDRRLLENLVKEIVEIEHNNIDRYSGNYTKYTEEKPKRIAARTAAYERQKEHIQRTEAFIRKNLAGQKTKQAKARRKQLAKTERLERPKAAARAAKLAFEEGDRSGHKVLTVHNLAKTYAPRLLFRNTDFEIHNGNRVGIVGPNGSGKSTLLKCILDRESTDEGTVKFGPFVETGYYDQQLGDLVHGKSVYDHVKDAKPEWNDNEIRSFLGAFLFSGDTVFRRVETFSGGEQSRVALAQLICSKVNFLMLDEPTNHLDILSRIALEESLREYPGTVLMVSHDRYFLDRVCTHILHWERQQFVLYTGNYTDMQYTRAQKAMQAPGPGVPQSKADRRKELAEKRQRKNRLDKVEREIERLEGLLEELTEEQLNEANAQDWEKLTVLENRKKTARKELDDFMAEWEELASEVE